MKPVQVLLIIVALAVLGVAITFAFATAIQKLDEDNRYSLAIQVIVAAMLGLFFWYLHKLDSDKMQEILNTQNNIIREDRERERKRKQFWANVAHSQLKAINSCHLNAREVCRRVLKKEIGNLDDATKRLKDLYSDAVKWFIPKLDRAMLQMADLLNDPSLFDSITENNYRQFTIMLDEAGGYLTDSEQIKHEIEVLDARIETIDGYLKRLEAEMASKEL